MASFQRNMDNCKSPGIPISWQDVCWYVTVTRNAISRPWKPSLKFRTDIHGSFSAIKFHQVRYCFSHIPRKLLRLTPLSLHNTNTNTPKTTPPKALTPADSYKILVSQRLNRPVAPHLAIYKWQITSVLSVLERITGAVLAGSKSQLLGALPKLLIHSGVLKYTTLLPKKLSQSRKLT